MAVPGEPHDDVVRPLYEAARRALPAGATWSDAHTHVGQDDPDGFTGTAGELLAALDRAGHRRALVFPMQEPAGYPPANDRVRLDAEASGGRLAWLGRIDPNAPRAIAEARRCLRAGARGLKLHPRSDAFGLPHPVVDEVAALVAAERGILLVHAGRGIPNLGEAAVALARRHPDLRLVLAHAGISDLGWLVEPARELPNLLFDTSWWQVWDLLQLFAHVPPARILYASDLPYGSGVMAGLLCLRCALEVGLEGDVLAAIVGGQLERLLAGEPPLELGPPPGPPRDEPRRLDLDRAVAHLTAAAQATLRGGDPAEALALARLACQSPHGDPVLACVDGLAARAQEAQDGAPPGGPERWPGLYAVFAAHLVAGTPHVALV
ncbi:MAG: amidohydrolase family protein [Actinomycetota bacterium]|nr:amidohydrolase family protein [Actinomycetota bacterium]